MARHEMERDVQMDSFVRTTHLELGEKASEDYHAVFGRMRPGITGLIIVAAIMLVSSLVVFQAHYSGIVRYILVALAITIMGIAVAWLASRASVDPAPLGWASNLNRVTTGEVSRMTRLLERGRDGLAVSQLQYVDRLRAAFLEKIRVQRGLSNATLQDLREDPDRLRDVVKDEEIATFLVEAEDARRRWSRIVRRRETALPSHGVREDFVQRMLRLVRRMEVWE